MRGRRQRLRRRHGAQRIPGTANVQLAGRHVAAACMADCGLQVASRLQSFETEMLAEEQTQQQASRPGVGPGRCLRKWLKRSSFPDSWFSGRGGIGAWPSRKTSAVRKSTEDTHCGGSKLSGL